MRLRHEYRFFILGKGFYNHKDCADFFGISVSMVAKILTGQREVSEGMARKLGYKKVIKRTVEYVKLENGKSTEENIQNIG